MDITEKDFEKIVFATTEKVLLRIPEVLGNLMSNHAEINKLTKQFYIDHPEFKSDPISVKAVIQELEQKYAALSHDEILKKSVPKIQERMKISSSLDTKNVSKLQDLDLRCNGEI